MMEYLTAKEKAKELVDSIIDIMPCLVNQTGESIMSYAKQCALIAVQNIICANPHSNPLNTNQYSTMSWWQDVKSEIEKL